MCDAEFQWWYLLFTTIPVIPFFVWFLVDMIKMDRKWKEMNRMNRKWQGE